MSKKKVAAYCRVTTSRYEQQESLENQINYYTDYINSNPDWENAGIYFDLGKTAKRRSKRTDYLRLLNDCRAGKIDMILCKGVRRFSRNLVHCLEDVRELTSLGVNVFFENENLDTGNMNGELILATVVSVSENELNNVSQNVKWANEKKFSEGKCILNSKRFLGYDVVNGELVINQAEAEIVKTVFKLYNDGYGTSRIASKLNSMGYRTVTGVPFSDSTITYMLKNEKYYGRLILHKYIRNAEGVSVLNDASKEPIYDWGIAHEAIVTKEVFDQAQKKLNEQKLKYKAKNNNPRKYDAFYETLICNKCGKPYVKVTHNSESKYPTENYTCTTYIKQGKSQCDNKPIKKKTLEKLFIKLHNELLSEGFDKPTARTVVLDELNRISDRIKELLDREKQFLIFIARGIDKKIYEKEYAELKSELEKSYMHKMQAEQECIDELQRVKKLKEIDAYFLNARPLDRFDESAFRLLVKEIIVKDREHLTFIFINGQEKSVRYVYQRYEDKI